MSVIQKLATFQGRRDEKPNEQLGAQIVKNNDKPAIKELIDGLDDKNRRIAGDCIKTLYWIGKAKPDLIKDYVKVFINLLKRKNNRLVWGGAISLSTIAALKADEIYKSLRVIYDTLESGSVITIDNCIKTLAIVASVKSEYNKEIFPYLNDYLLNTRIASVAQYAESIFVAVNKGNKEKFKKVLERRLPELNKTQSSRINKLLKKLN